MSNARRMTRSFALTALAAAALAGPVSANPKGPQVVGGSAQVSGTGTSSVIVNQQTDRAIINWQTFDIGAGEQVRFNQPGASSIMLNRVIGGLGPSVIAGTLTANGRVFLVNPDGMLFGAGAVINTSGFLATTHDITNDDFMAGNFRFDIPGRPDASIVNLGTITASNAGFAALVAPGVRNSGTISARLGTVALASANSFTLDFYGDQLITLSVSDEIAANVKDAATGEPLGALVGNDGRLSANGGQVQMSAATARKVVDSVINNTGVIEARAVGMRNGRIVLGAQPAATKTAGAPKQTVKVSGTLDVSGRKAGERGGKVQVTGERIEVARADIDASGRAGGGTVLIGGDTGGGRDHWAADRHGKAALEDGPVPTATEVTVDVWSRIDASAKGSGAKGSGAKGAGGKVIVWADDSTAFAGTILAKGGAAGGDGGFVEVSGHQRLGFSGTVDVSAPAGQAGLMLLDPRDIQIGGTGEWVVTVEALLSALSSGDVSIVTGSTGPGNGDIVVAQSFSWGNDSRLTFGAFGDVVFNDGVTVANTGAGEFNVAAGVAIDSDGLGTPTSSGTVRFLGNSKIDYSQSFGLVRFAHHPTSGSYETPDDFSGRVLTNGAWQGGPAEPTQFTAYMWVKDALDLQSIGASTATLAGNYLISGVIDAGGIENFDPIGSWGDPFTGRLVGLDATIANLHVHAWGGNVGLFRIIGEGGIVSGIHLENASIKVGGAFGYAGILAGINRGTIFRSTVSGSVGNVYPAGWQESAIGGLVGLNVATGRIIESGSHASLFVKSPFNGFGTNGYVDGGGLAGINSGTIARSFATGTIWGWSGSWNARSYLGGLVGWQKQDGPNQPLIEDSYSLAAIKSFSGNTTAGGLVGVLGGGKIRHSYAAGAVHVLGGNVTTGGLVGNKTGGWVQQSVWDFVATGQTASAGGLGLPTLDLEGELPSGFSSSVWTVDPLINGNYPHLVWQTATDTWLGTVLQPGLVEKTLTVVPPDDFAKQQISNLEQTFNTDPPENLIPDPPPDGGDGAGNGGQGGGTGGQAGGGNGGQPPLRKVPGPDGERFSSVPPPGETRFLDTEVVVQIPDRITEEQLQAVAKKLGLTLITSEDLPLVGRRSYRFSLPPGWTVREMILALESFSIIAVAQPNYTYELARAAQAPASAPTTEPSGELRGDPAQYVMGKLQLAQVHRLADGRDVIVAVIDSEVDREHSELTGVVLEHYSTSGGEGVAPHSHGTAMAGAIAARDRLLGVAPRARILAVRAFSEQDSTAASTSYNIVRSINWAVDQGARIVNMSFAGPRDPALQRVLQAAAAKNVVLVAAAGNAGPKAAPLYPGADSNVIAVTATDANDQVFRLAGRGRHISIAAPGVDILAPAPDAGYQMSTGTSIATAHVSGVVALMLERDPSLTPAQVREILQTTARDLGSQGRDNAFGWGLVDPQRALQAVMLRDAARSRLQTQ